MSPRPIVLPVDGCVQGALDELLVAADVRRDEPIPHEIVITVYGIAAPQGSKTPKGSYVDKKSGKRHVRLVESSKKVKPWREDVAAAARIACAGREPLTGPLVASMVFTLPRPGRIPAERFVDGVPYPMCYPDASKLARSTEDALTGIAWVDDAQVVGYERLDKRYPGTPGALDRPGALIRVRRIGGAP